MYAWDHPLAQNRWGPKEIRGLAFGHFDAIQDPVLLHMLVRHRYANGAETCYEYDHYTPKGRVKEQKEKEGLTRSYSYFPAYTLVSDSLGRTERYDGEAGVRYEVLHSSIFIKLKT